MSDTSENSPFRELPVEAIKPSFGQRLQSLAKIALIAAVVSGPSGDHAHRHPADLYDNPYHPQGVTFDIDSGSQITTIHFGDIRDTSAFSEPETPTVKPGSFLQRLITTDDPFEGRLGLAPSKIANPTTFKNWIDAERQNPELEAQANIAPNELHPTPQQLIKLTTAIVNEKTHYGYDIPVVESNYKKPMDQNLEQGRPLDCEGFSGATEAVFNVLKTEYPEELNNTYLVTASGPAAGHVWNEAIQVESPTQASVSFVDSTVASKTYNDGPRTQLGGLQFLTDISRIDKNLAPDEVTLPLIVDYLKNTELTSMDKDALSVLQDMPGELPGGRFTPTGGY